MQAIRLEREESARMHSDIACPGRVLFTDLMAVGHAGSRWAAGCQ